MKKYLIKNEPLLKIILQIDAIFGLALAVIGLAFTAFISNIFALPYWYILITAVIIGTYSTYTLVLTMAKQLVPNKVFFLFVINTIWSVKAVVFIFYYFEIASKLGIAYLISELAVVLGFALLQIWQLKRI